MRKLNRRQTTLFETLKGLEHTLKSENFLGQLFNVHAKLLNIFFNVDSRHLLI